MDYEAIELMSEAFHKAAIAKRALVIDDHTGRHEGLEREYGDEYQVDHAYNFAEAKALLDANHYNLICFDHDLEDFQPQGELTGATIARYMAYNRMTCDMVRVHSHNPEGAKNIVSIVNSGNIAPKVWYEPFQIFPGADMEGLKEDFENAKPGDKIAAEILSISESDGSKAVTIKLGKEFNNQIRKLFFLD